MAPAGGTVLERVRLAATRPVSSASIAFFRMAFGVAMVVNAALYLPTHVREYYVDTTVHFPYGPLDAVRPLPGPGMYLVYVAMALAGALLAAGRWSRWAAGSFFALTTYVFLIDSTFFQNHEYLISLLALLVTLLPVHGRWSVDARRHPERRVDQVPAWVVWLLRFQIGVPYFFGGVAKLSSDWFRGEPLRRWLANRSGVPAVDAVLTYEPVVRLMAYGSLAFDLVIVWLLLHRRTRVPAYLTAVVFHLLNAWLWGLWIFPWLMIVATTIFFAPEWPERVLARLGAVVPALPSARASGRVAMSPVVVALLAAWVLVQVALPMRHLAYRGSPSWTEEGHRFAWHMKLRDKVGTATFVVTAGDQTWRIDPASDLRGMQLRRLPGHPERLVHLARRYSKAHGGAEVQVETSVSLNGRRPQPIVDPTIDLASVRWRPNAPWVVPLIEPLPRR